MLSILTSLMIPAAFAFSFQPDAQCRHRITFLPQTHRSDDVSAADTAHAERIRIARSQLKIVNYLDHSPPFPVFSEQMSYEDVVAAELPSELRDAMAKEVADAFPDGLDVAPEALTDAQMDVLIDNGADGVQVMRGRLDVVHRVSKDQATKERIWGPILDWFARHPNDSKYPPEVASLIYGEREREALRQINAFFEAHPEEHMATLIFGSNHNFRLYPELFSPGCVLIPADFMSEWFGFYRSGPDGFPPTTQAPPAAVPSHQ